MKKLAFLLFLPFILSSCLKEGSDYRQFTGWIDIDTIVMTDTAMLNSEVLVRVSAGAPNGCWSNLEIDLLKENDSVYTITGSGKFESYNGICSDEYVGVDSTFKINPSKEGKLLLIAFSPNRHPIKDSLIVIPLSGK
jgi:hypothetical protein